MEYPVIFPLGAYTKHWLHLASPFGHSMLPQLASPVRHLLHQTLKCVSNWELRVASAPFCGHTWSHHIGTIWPQHIGSTWPRHVAQFALPACHCINSLMLVSNWELCVASAPGCGYIWPQQDVAIWHPCGTILVSFIALIHKSVYLIGSIAL